MVVLGGVTRLTRSGLSIVEWRAAGEAYPQVRSYSVLCFAIIFCPLTFTSSVQSDEEWNKYFDMYKAFPEFQRVNRNMTLEEFKVRLAALLTLHAPPHTPTLGEMSADHIFLGGA